MMKSDTPSPEEWVELALKVKKLADCYAAVPQGGSYRPGGETSWTEIDRERLSPEQREIIPVGCNSAQANDRAINAQKLYDWLKDPATEGEPIPDECDEILEAARKLS